MKFLCIIQVRNGYKLTAQIVPYPGSQIIVCEDAKYIVSAVKFCARYDGKYHNGTIICDASQLHEYICGYLTITDDILRMQELINKRKYFRALL